MVVVYYRENLTLVLYEAEYSCLTGKLPVLGRSKEVMLMKKLSALDWIALILIVVGGLNWGLVGAFKFNLVAAIFGDMSAIARIVYILVGLSALYTIFILGKLGKK